MRVCMGHRLWYCCCEVWKRVELSISLLINQSCSSYIRVYISLSVRCYAHCLIRIGLVLVAVPRSRTPPVRTQPPHLPARTPSSAAAATATGSFTPIKSSHPSSQLALQNIVRATSDGTYISRAGTLDTPDFADDHAWVRPPPTAPPDLERKYSSGNSDAFGGDVGSRGVSRHSSSVISGMNAPWVCACGVWGVCMWCVWLRNARSQVCVASPSTITLNDAVGPQRCI